MAARVEKKKSERPPTRQPNEALDSAFVNCLGRALKLLERRNEKAALILPSLRQLLQLAEQEGQKALDRKIPRLRNADCHSPLFSEVTLFAPIDQGRLEVSQTRALAWILDREQEHGFCDELAQALVWRVLNLQFDANYSIKDININEVAAERIFDGRHRADVFLSGHLKTRADKWCIYIEAKVDAPFGPGQLDGYLQVMEESKYADDRKRLIVLTPSKYPLPHMHPDLDKLVLRMTFRELAGILGAAAIRLKKRPGFEFLRLYLAGLLRDVEGVPIPLGDRCSASAVIQLAILEEWNL